MRLSAIWLFLTEEWMAYLAVGAFVLFLLGVARWTMLAVLAAILAGPYLAPHIEEYVAGLPLWAIALLLAALALMVMKDIAALALGRQGAETMLGSLAADAVRLLIRAAVFPLRMVFRLLAGLLREEKVPEPPTGELKPAAVREDKTEETEPAAEGHGTEPERSEA